MPFDRKAELFNGYRAESHASTEHFPEIRAANRATIRPDFGFMPYAVRIPTAESEAQYSVPSRPESTGKTRKLRIGPSW